MAQLQHPVPFDIDENALATDPASSDHFVYSPWFMIYDPYLEANIAHLPSYQLDRIALGLRLIKSETLKEKLLHRYEGLDDHVRALADVIAQLEKKEVAGPSRGAAEVSRIAESVKKVSQQVTRAVRSGDITPAVGDMLALSLSAATAAAQNAEAPKPQMAILVQSGGMGSSTSTASTGSMTGQTLVSAFVGSELGYLFLDR